MPIVKGRTAVSLPPVSSVTAMNGGDSTAVTAGLSVIVPVYNEVSTIKTVLQRIVCEPTPKEVIVVDDGSTDGTAEAVAAWIQHGQDQLQTPHVTRIVALQHPLNRGKGAAIRTGLEHARSEFIVVQDADLEVSPEEYPWLLKPLLAGEADIVVGYRTQSEPGLARLGYTTGISLLNLAVRWLYGVSLRDEACCFKVLRTAELKRMDLVCDRFEFCPEVIAKSARLGLRFAEVPVSYSPRTCAQGKKLRWKDGFQALWTLWRYRRWRGLPRTESSSSLAARSGS